MQTAPHNHSYQDTTADGSHYANHLSISQQKTADYAEWSVHRIVSVLLALLPVASFLVQYVLSIRAGTQQIMLHHMTIMVSDWIFVPLNFFLVRLIDWERGLRLYLITCISIGMNVLANAYWQYNGLDAGHLITKSGIILPAGWVHLASSIVEMILLVAFVFCRKGKASGTGLVTILAASYFLLESIFGYVMHHGFIISDVIVSAFGIFFILVYPKLNWRKQVS
jgi:hypothetical protein